MHEREAGHTIFEELGQLRHNRLFRVLGFCAGVVWSVNAALYGYAHVTDRQPQRLEFTGEAFNDSAELAPTTVTDESLTRAVSTVSARGIENRLADGQAAPNRMTVPVPTAAPETTATTTTTVTTAPPATSPPPTTTETTAPPAAAAEAEPPKPTPEELLTELFVGNAHLEADPAFQAPFAGAAEISVVYFNGKYRMYYRTYERLDGQGRCPVPTGIALAESDDGNVFAPVNGGQPLAGIHSSGEPGCPAEHSSVWKYAPKVIITATPGGPVLQMFYEERHQEPVRPTMERLDFSHYIVRATSPDGINWSNNTVIIQPDRSDIRSPFAEVGTPDIVQLPDGSCLLTGHSAQYTDLVNRSRFIRWAAASAGPCTPDATYTMLTDGQSLLGNRYNSPDDFGPGMVSLFHTPVQNAYFGDQPVYVGFNEQWHYDASRHGIPSVCGPNTGNYVDIRMFAVRRRADTGFDVYYQPSDQPLFTSEKSNPCANTMPTLMYGAQTNEPYLIIAGSTVLEPPRRYRIVPN